MGRAGGVQVVAAVVPGGPAAAEAAAVGDVVVQVGGEEQEHAHAHAGPPTPLQEMLPQLMHALPTPFKRCSPSDLRWRLNAFLQRRSTMPRRAYPADRRVPPTAPVTALTFCRCKRRGD